MIIGLDLDGVTGDYVNALRLYVAKKNGISPEDAHIHYPDPHDYQFSNWTEVAQSFAKWHTEAVDAGLYEDMVALPGASEHLWKLSNAGHHIRVITSRFVRAGQNSKVIAATGFWLDKNDIPYRSVAFTSDKNDVNADIYIDDAPKNILGFQEINKPYIIFDAPYNKDLEGPRVDNWVDAYRLFAQFSEYLDGKRNTWTDLD